MCVCVFFCASAHPSPCPLDKRLCIRFNINVLCWFRVSLVTATSLMAENFYLENFEAQKHTHGLCEHTLFKHYDAFHRIIIILWVWKPIATHDGDGMTETRECAYTLIMSTIISLSITFSMVYHHSSNRFHCPVTITVVVVQHMLPS